MNYSAELQQKIDELGLKKENILYLPIAQGHLRRITEKIKTVEFRDLSDFYLKKINKYNSKGEYIEAKPLSHVLFQGGYNTDSPRVLTELKAPVQKYNADKKNPAEIINNNLEVRKMTIEDGKEKYPKIFEEAKVEGFEDDDEYLAFQLGEICHIENF